jgi:hypothetical protein
MPGSRHQNTPKSLKVEVSKAPKTRSNITIIDMISPMKSNDSLVAALFLIVSNSSLLRDAALNRITDSNQSSFDLSVIVVGNLKKSELDKLSNAVERLAMYIIEEIEKLCKQIFSSTDIDKAVASISRLNLALKALHIKFPMHC